MGMFDFVRSAGERLRGGKDLDENEIRDHLLAQGLQLKPLSVIADAANGHVRLVGFALTLEDKEKAIVAAGNIDGVEKVEDRLKIGVPEWLARQEAGDTAEPDAEAADEEPELAAEDEPQAQFHTVKSGDSLSGISKQVYGDAMKYTVIFEANKPMLSDPNKIYPGQVLRIPPL